MKLGYFICEERAQISARDILICKVSFVCCLQLYHPLSVYIVLVGIEVWATTDQITVNGADHLQTLADFCDYRANNINPSINNDNAHLIT